MTSACNKSNMFCFGYIHSTQWTKYPKTFSNNTCVASGMFGFSFGFLIFKIGLIFNCVLNYSHSKVFSYCGLSKCPASLLYQFLYICIHIQLSRPVNVVTELLLCKIHPESILIFMFCIAILTAYTIVVTNIQKVFH